MAAEILRDKDLDRAIAVAVGQMSGGRRQEYLQRMLEEVSPSSLASFISGANLKSAEQILEQCDCSGISVVPLCAPEYPSALRETGSPPPVLYVLGDVTVLAKACRCVSVVGTRSASVEVCQLATELSADLARAGCTIVSGLALGIDGAAHRGALLTDNPMPTIAVLAHGLDRVYPATHQPLARQILSKGGALLSEYPPGTEPLKHHFLARNRLIAGLSRGTVVVQAGARSGSLVTAQFAADYGRDVFILETDTHDERAAGGASMLEQGAIPIASAAQVLLEYGWLPRDVADKGAALLVPEWRVVTIESFMTITGCSNADILRLELRGLALRLPGNRLKIPVELLLCGDSSAASEV